MSLEQHKWYRRNLQLTPEGVDRYHELSSRQTLGSTTASQFAALEMLITLHPLDYVYKRLPTGVKPAFLGLIERGYAEEVGDRYGHMASLLSQKDPELLPTFRVYEKLAQGEEVTEEELDRALSTLKKRALEEAEHMAIRRHLDEFVETIGEPTTQEEKVHALDAAMHELHWDPDLLRQLSQRDQSLVGGSIQSWLRKLAGDKVPDEEVGE